MQDNLFIGLDVHKATISVAVAQGERGGEVRCWGTIPNRPDQVRRLCEKLAGDGRRLHVCYEAGPCGYGLHRQLTELGHDCVVVAPSLIPVRTGDRVKTDRRDAAMLAKLHRAGELTAVWVPDAAHEAMRDLVRARATAVRVTGKARQHLQGFLLRHGRNYPGITGESDGVPMKLGVAITDIVTGMNATQAILAALFARERTGRGQVLDIALFDSAIALLANVGTGHLATGEAPGRLGNAHATVVPYQLFDTQDGVVALAVGNDQQFEVLCARVLDRPDLAEDSRFATNRGRALNRAELIPSLAAIFASAPTGHWIARLKAEGVPGGKVRTVPEALAAPEVVAREMVVTVPDSVHGTLRLLGSLRYAGAGPRRSAPSRRTHRGSQTVP